VVLTDRKVQRYGVKRMGWKVGNLGIECLGNGVLELLNAMRTDTGFA